MTAASMISQRKFQSDYQRKIGYMYEKSTENKTCYLFNEKIYRIGILYSCLLYTSVHLMDPVLMDLSALKNLICIYIQILTALRSSRGMREETVWQD